MSGKIRKRLFILSKSATENNIVWEDKVEEARISHIQKVHLSHATDTVVYRCSLYI